ncbi:hypothetical protein Hypma_000649 [Hypsizygus marmoreus]|uniref:Uncharacterized protein n=1 Tax=Hypsizygus marmoreus TaxID=39966 RepID=A0A369JF01_HYPMA|nr:hypothetical protein Hypma_000649 [Hypsizygus marmoreus]
MPSTVRGADFNAFGYDPKGHKAYIASLFYGPDWLPDAPRQQFGGRPEPPRYGPPARYQRACLPEGWKPRPPRDLYNCGGPMPPFLPPPKVYNPNWCRALLVSRRFQADAAIEESDSDESDVPTSPVDPSDNDVEKEEDDADCVLGKGIVLGSDKEAEGAMTKDDARRLGEHEWKVDVNIGQGDDVVKIEIKRAECDEGGLGGGSAGRLGEHEWDIDVNFKGQPGDVVKIEI